MAATADISASGRWGFCIGALFFASLKAYVLQFLPDVIGTLGSFLLETHTDAHPIEDIVEKEKIDYFHLIRAADVDMDDLSAKGLETAMRSMLPYFEGRESEANWKQRERSIHELVKLTQSNAPKNHPTQFAAGIKLLLDGIVKTVQSLRTTLQRDGCEFVKELAKFLGPSFDPMVLDILLPVLIDLCGQTKALARKNGDETVSTVLTHVNINPRIIGYINGASKDKNDGPRIFASRWIKIIIQKHGRHCEHGGGHEKLEECIRLGLRDAKPETRESMRDTYWTFARVWPGRAESIMSELDPKAQKTLEDNNPNRVSSRSTNVASKSNAPSKNSSIAAIKAAKMKAMKAAREETAAATTQSVSRPTSSLATHPTEPIEDLAHSKSTMSAPVRPTVHDLVPQKRAIKVTARPHHTNHPEIPRPTSSLSSSTKIHHGEQSDELPFSRSTASVPARAPVRDDTSSKRAQRAAVPEAPTNTKQETSRSHKVATADATISSKQDTSRPNSSHESSTGLLSSAPVRRPRGLPPTIKPRAERTAPNAEPENEVAIPTLVNTAVSDRSQHVARTERHPKTRRLPETEAAPLHIPLPLPMAEAKLQPVEHVLPTSPDMAFPPAAPSATLVADMPLPLASSTTIPAAHTSQPLADAKPAPALVPDSHIPFIPIYDISIDPSMRDPRERKEDEEETTQKHTWHNKETAERRRSISPNSQDPTQARKQVASGIEKIRSGKIDDFGYRKLQGLIHFHDKIFRDEHEYDEMLLVLLSALEAPNTEKRRPLGRKYDSKFQILVTIRLMFIHNRKYFAAYFPRAMSALLVSRRNFEARHHIVSGLEETAQDIVGACQPPDVIDAVLDVLETEERDEAGSRTLAMGLHILSGLSARMRALKKSLDSQQEQRMAKFGLKCLREPNSIVRRAVIEYCLELRRIIKTEQRFFRLVTGDNEDLKNLITYYVANRNE